MFEGLWKGDFVINIKFWFKSVNRKILFHSHQEISGSSHCIVGHIYLILKRAFTKVPATLQATFCSIGSFMYLSILVRRSWINKTINNTEKAIADDVFWRKMQWAAKGEINKCEIHTSVPRISNRAKCGWKTWVARTSIMYAKIIGSFGLHKKIMACDLITLFSSRKEHDNRTRLRERKKKKKRRQGEKSSKWKMKSEKIVTINDDKTHFSVILITRSLEYTLLFQTIVCID